MTPTLGLMWALFAAADLSDGRIPPVASDAFFVFIIVMTTSAVLLLLLLVILLAVKMSIIMRRLDEISSSANEFLAMGVKFFKDKQH